MSQKYCVYSLPRSCGRGPIRALVFCYNSESMQEAFDIIPYTSIHTDRITLYSKVHWYKPRPKVERAKNFGATDKKHHGKISIHARRKVNKAVNYLMFMANDKYLPDTAHGKQYNFKLAFITLTLPSTQVHDDNEVKADLLNQFMVECRHVWNVRNYIWRAEKQKNGNIHFHILVDRFVPWSELRDRWNRICNKKGYVDRYRDQMRSFHSNGFQVRQDLLKNWEYKKQVKAYREGKANDWNSPNSTDIHSLRRINRVAAYILKYMTKDDDAGEIKGRMWGCNFELSDIKGGQVIADSRVKDEINHLLTSKQVKRYDGDYFTVLEIESQKLVELGCPELYKVFCSFMFNHFRFNVQSRTFVNP